MQFIRTGTLIIIGFFGLISCKQSASDKKDAPVAMKRKEPEKIGFHFDKPKQWLKSPEAKVADARQIVFAVNRMDADHLSQADSILVPDDLSGDIAYYLPFPLRVPGLEDIGKIIFFSYPAQAFGAYEKGNLVYTGPTNMGRKKDPTPVGLYHTNWKAEKTTSTFNDEWELKWNFNIQNKEGIGWHQYELPGYPASHSCLRLLEKDARYLYDWADEWKLKGSDSVLRKGTPVVVFGAYDFDGPRPWLQLKDNPHILDISKKQLENEVAAFRKEL